MSEHAETLLIPAALAANPTPWPGTAAGPQMVGPYRLVRLLGRGGMGTVWLAERADGEFNKRVALKLVNRDGDPHELARRFRVERQILAALAHPNVAALHDGNTTADGLPYFVLEYVDGRPLTQFCDEEMLDIRERLRLFAAVVAAVAHAHSRLVVHRDLKPSNVLVTADRQVKLLDFGIAKLLDGRNPELTERDGFALTPRYAAPEQINGGPITVATDVYALGVLLYELLCGRSPYPVDGSQLGALALAITQADPPSLSQALTQKLAAENEARRRFEARCDCARLRSELSGDLQLIVGKAMRKNPTERYSSVEALAQDLERYLALRPVLARAPSTLYTLHKWLTRNRWFALSGLLATAALVGAMVALWSERERTAAALADAENARGFLLSLFEDAAPVAIDGGEATVRGLLKRAAARTEQIEDVARRAQLTVLIAQLMNDYGDYSAAEVLSNGALAMPESAPAARHPLLLQRARARQGQTDLGGAETDLRALLSEPALEPTLRPQVRLALGRLLTAASRLEEALALLNDARAEFAALGPGARSDWAQATIALAFAMDLGNQPARALAELDQALLRLSAQPSTAPALIGRIQYQRAVSLRTSGELKAATVSLREAISRLEPALGADHPETLGARRLYGDLLDELGDLEGAHQALTEVADLAAARYGAQSISAIEILNSLAALDQRRARYGAAAEGFRRVVDGLTGHYGADHNDTAVARSNLAHALFELGRLDEARNELRASLEVNRARMGADSLDAMLTLAALGRVERYANQLDQAASYTDQAVTLARQTLAATHPVHLRIRAQQLAIAVDRGRSDATLPTELADLLGLLVEGTPRIRRMRIEVLSIGARAALARGDARAAQRQAGEAFAIAQIEYPDGGRQWIEALAERLAAERALAADTAVQSAAMLSAAIRRAPTALSPRVQGLATH